MGQAVIQLIQFLCGYFRSLGTWEPLSGLPSKNGKTLLMVRQWAVASGSANRQLYKHFNVAQEFSFKNTLLGTHPREIKMCST